MQYDFATLKKQIFQFEEQALSAEKRCSTDISSIIEELASLDKFQKSIERDFKIYKDGTSSVQERKLATELFSSWEETKRTLKSVKVGI